MDAFLGKITQHAMNYAIRSGIGITASYAINQTSRLLKTVDNSSDYQELHDLQERLDGKIRIISPAIDMIELISARGNTTLESAVTLTKTLRWDIQSLGIRLEKAASAEELSRRNKSRVKSRAAHEAEIRLIVKDIRKFLARIEDAVPLINLAITTSGASLSTTLPATVSPSRLLQASTFLTAGDTQYSLSPNSSVQVGPSFTLSLYMLFAGHAYRLHDDIESVRDTTWKEVIHKARVKLLRVPHRLQGHPETVSSPPGFQGNPQSPQISKFNKNNQEDQMIAGQGRATEFAYQLELIEDLEDDRAHSFEEDEPQPGPYGDVQLAGIREFVPIYQISKIFYADTGKILNIGSPGETNSPVLLLKRDINALPPRRMMQGSDNDGELYGEPEDVVNAEEISDDPQDDIDQQIRRESSVPPSDQSGHVLSGDDRTWRFPPNLDPEWLALEVYTEVEDMSSEEGQETNYDSAYESPRRSSARQTNDDSNLSAGLSNLGLDEASPPPLSRRQSPDPLPVSFLPKLSPFGPVRSSLSLLEMLIRLTSLQQFQQASHLAIPDELLSFFLEESSATGAGGDGEERQRTRREARRKVGFDPYDESPIKRRGEGYQYQGHGQDGYEEYSRVGTSCDEYEHLGGYVSPRLPKDSSMTPQGTPERWLLRSRDTPPGFRQATPDISSSPASPYPARKNVTDALGGAQQGRRGFQVGSPLGRGMSVETDSSLGTSPGSPIVASK